MLYSEGQYPHPESENSKDLLIQQLIEDRLAKHADVFLKEGDVMDYLGLPEYQLHDFLEQILFHSDLEYFATQHLFSMFPQYSELVQQLPGFDKPFEMSVSKNSFSEVNITLKDILLSEAEFDRILPQDLLEQIRFSVLRHHGRTEVFGTELEQQAANEFLLRIVDAAEITYEFENKLFDPIEFKKNIDWKLITEQLWISFFKLGAGWGTVGIYLPEKGWNDHLVARGSTVEQLKSESPPDGDPYDTSNALVVTDQDENLELFITIIENQHLRSFLLKSQFLYGTQNQIYNLILEVFDDAADKKRDNLERFGNHLTVYFLHQFLLRIKKGKSLTLLGTFWEDVEPFGEAEKAKSEDDTSNPEQQLVPYLMKVAAGESGLYQIEIIKKSITDRFKKLDFKKSEVIGSYLLGIKYAEDDLEALEPQLYYREVKKGYSYDQDIHRLKPLDLSDEYIFKKPLSVLLDGFNCFTSQSVLELMSLTPQELENYFGRIKECPNAVSLLAAMDQLSCDVTTIGRLFLVPNRFAIQYVREPHEEEAGLTEIKLKEGRTANISVN